MCMNNNDSCLWIILILIVLVCCCGNHSIGGCGHNHSCGNNCTCC